MTSVERIALVSDFGTGPYIGQVQLLLHKLVSAVPVVDLVSDLVPFRADLAAYLLPGLVRDVPEKTLLLCVVDPGVGGVRGGLLCEAEGRWFVGPDNGLLSRVIARAGTAKVWQIDWIPPTRSDSFHGRDWFAPVAAAVANGQMPQASERDPGDWAGADWADELAAIVYVDRYGNLITGLRAPATDAIVACAGRHLRYARTFCEIAGGEAFWYQNAFGLLEISVNLGRADESLGLVVGDLVEVVQGR